MTDGFTPETPLLCSLSPLEPQLHLVPLLRILLSALKLLEDVC
jgi:hypothetical protein